MEQKITPATSHPNDAAVGTIISSCDSAEVFLDVTAGTGTAYLAQKSPGGKYHQYGPSWSVDNTVAGRQVGRIAIPREPAEYIVVVTGGPTLGAECWIRGVTRGR